MPNDSRPPSIRPSSIVKAVEHTPPNSYMPIRAVLSDFDGVIIDHDALMIQAYAELATLQPELNLSGGRRAVLGTTTDPHELKVFQFRHDRESALFKHGAAIYDNTHPKHLHAGAEEVMDTYERNKIPWAVISNNPLTGTRWNRLGLNEKFPDVPVFDNAEKPSEKCLKQALTQLNQRAGKDIIMVDDGCVGLVAAAKLGITPVYIGDRAHIEVPKAIQECRKLDLDPYIFTVRNNAELSEFVTRGIPLTNETAQYLW